MNSRLQYRGQIVAKIARSKREGVHDIVDREWLKTLRCRKLEGPLTIIYNLMYPYFVIDSPLGRIVFSPRTRLPRSCRGMWMDEARTAQDKWSGVTTREGHPVQPVTNV